MSETKHNKEIELIVTIRSSTEKILSLEEISRLIRPLLTEMNFVLVENFVSSRTSSEKYLVIQTQTYQFSEK